MVGTSGAGWLTVQPTPVLLLHPSVSEGPHLRVLESLVVQSPLGMAQSGDRLHLRQHRGALPLLPVLAPMAHVRGGSWLVLLPPRLLDPSLGCQRQASKGDHWDRVPPGQRGQQDSMSTMQPSAPLRARPLPSVTCGEGGLSLPGSLLSVRRSGGGFRQDPREHQASATVGSGLFGWSFWVPEKGLGSGFAPPAASPQLSVRVPGKTSVALRSRSSLGP